jgi:hypothetical protein
VYHRLQPVPAPDQTLSTAAAADLSAYLDELWQRLPEFALHAAGLPAEERGSFEWLVSAGEFWQAAREQAGMERETAAAALGWSVNRLRLMEYGLLAVSPRSLSGRRWRRYAAALGDPELIDRFREHFE